MRIMLSIAIFLVCACCLNAGKLELLPGTPVFQKPDATSEPMLFVLRPTSAQTLAGTDYFLDSNFQTRHFTFYQIQLAPEKYGWVAPDIKYFKNPSSGQVEKTILKQNSAWRKVFLGLIIAGLAACAVIFFASRKKRSGAPLLELSRWQLALLAVAFLILLRWLLLLIVVMRGYNTYIFCSDEPDFFKIALDMYNGGVSCRWPRSIGQALCYLPFVAAFKAKTAYDILISFSWFSGFVLMPLTLALFYFIVRKLTGSEKKAFFSTLLWVTVPMFFHHMERLDQNLIKSFFSFNAPELSFRFYKNLIWGGFNAMSDTPSLLAVILCIFAGLYMKPGLRMMGVVAAIFSFACLIRINNIFFAPMIAWIFWDRNCEQFRNLRFLLTALLVSVGTFLLVFSPQLVVNKVQFGSIFTFPYVLYEKTADGFEWAMLSVNIPLLAKANYALWTLGAFGLLLLKNKKLRTLLALWAIPVILFFFGYVFTQDDTTRFIFPAYGAMFAAFICCEIWEKINRREMILLIVMMALSLLFTCPAAYGWEIQLPWDWQMYSWGVKTARILNWTIPAIALLITLSFYRNRNLLLASLCFMLIYFPGNAYTFAALFSIILLRAIFDWIIEAKNFIRQ